VIYKRTNMLGMTMVLESLPKHYDESIKETLEYFCEKILIKHFSFAAAKERGYAKLSPQYAKRKLAKYGRQPILVASGTLRESATTMYKVYKKAGKYQIHFNIPEYGKYVIEKGRDWLTPSKKDEKDLSRYWKVDMQKRRRIFARGLPQR
jgi:hypothetical protein